MNIDAILNSLDLTYVDITAYLGLFTIALLTINIILGILVSIQFDAKKFWPYKNIQFFNLHNWTGYAALFVALLHPASLLLSETTKFHLFDILLPIKAPFQPLENSIGALTLYCLIFVVVTSYLRNKFRYSFWKKLHYVSYAIFVLMFYHGIFTDPSLKDLPVDYLDGGKLFTEGSLLAVILFIALRLKVFRKRKNIFKGELIIDGINDLSSEIKEFRFVYSQGNTIPFSYQSGQFLNFFISQLGKRFLRSYSLTSDPSEKNFVSIAVKRGQGDGSKYFFETLKPGSKITVNGPFGDFTFSGKSKNILFIAGGIGITPLFSILKDLGQKKWKKSTLLVYCARTKDDLVFRTELEALKSKMPNLRICYVLSKEVIKEPGFYFGFPDLEMLRTILSDEPFARVHLCGSDPMMNLVKDSLANLNFNSHRIHTESFGSALVPEINFPTTKAICTVQGLKEKVIIEEKTTILDALFNAGIDVTASCRQGSCGACKIKVLKGSTKQSVEGFLAPPDVRSGFVLSCVGYCQSPEIEIAIDS